MTFLFDRSVLLSSKLFFRFYYQTKFLCISRTSLYSVEKDALKRKMEIVKIPPIVATYRQALKTFDDSNKGEIAGNLSKLKTMMDSLRAEDLGFDHNLSKLDIWKLPNKAPCTYIQVFQNNIVNMSIFVLKPGFKMPLHDHPHMHGLLKVLTSSVNIRSFTEYPMDEAINKLDFNDRVKLEAARLAQSIYMRRRFFAEVTQDRVCNTNSETCMLTPTISNYHEIEALDMPAAFFDILAPPYDTLIEGIGPRRCRYYRVANEINSNLVELQETDVPRSFFCDQAPYLGPSFCM